MKATRPPVTTVVFDGDCAMCSAFIRFCYSYVKKSDVIAVSFHKLSPMDAARLGLRLDDCREALYCVTPAGAILKGAGACNYLLRPVPFLGRMLRMIDSNPVLSKIESYCYHQVARNRRKVSRILGLDACAIP